MDDFMTSLTAAHEEVMEALHFNVTEMWNRPGITDGVREFTDAIAWDEPFFQGLFAVHFLLFCATLHVCLHKGINTVIVLFALFAVMVFGAEHLNTWGAQHYRSLFPVHSTNYFDPSGIFVSVIYSAPLLVYAFLLQMRMLATVSKMLIVVKRQQARQSVVSGKANGTTSAVTARGKEAGGAAKPKRK